MQYINLTKNTNCDLKYSSIIDFIELLLLYPSEISNLLKTTITVDSNLNSQSDNPVKNSTITKELFNKVDKSALKNIAYTGKYLDLMCAPTRLPNPESLIIKYPNKTVLYDGTEAVLIDSNDINTGVPESLIKEIELFNNRITALESDKLTSKVVIYAPDVIEYIPNHTSSSITIQLQNSNGIISKDANYTNKHLYYNINNRGEVDVQDDNVNVEYKYNAPAQVNIEARGIANYKGAPITFPIVRKTIYAVLPSYIGYIEDYNNWNNTGTKLVKHSLNGQYNVVNPYDLAYLVIAIPKNGMVSNISNIIQKGTLDAVQQYNVIDKGNYTLYVCNTKHNKGTYTFAVS